MAALVAIETYLILAVTRNMVFNSASPARFALAVVIQSDLEFAKPEVARDRRLQLHEVVSNTVVHIRVALEFASSPRKDCAIRSQAVFNRRVW